MYKFENEFLEQRRSGLLLHNNRIAYIKYKTMDTPQIEKINYKVSKWLHYSP